MKTIAAQLAAAALLHPASAYAPLSGATARSVATSEDVDLNTFVSTPSPSGGKKTMLVLGTYAADFNAIEYAQRYGRGRVSISMLELEDRTHLIA